MVKNLIKKLLFKLLSNNKRMINEKTNQIINKIIPFSVPIYFLEGSGLDANNISSNATGALIYTGEKKLLITCHHVWDEFKKKKEVNASINLWVGRGNARQTAILDNINFIDGDKENLDIAIFEFANTNIFKDSEKNFYRIDNWPIVLPSPGDLICFVGYPGNERQCVESGKGIFSGTVLVADIATVVSERHIILADEENAREQIKYNPKAKKIESLGGISGAPAFVNRHNRFELIGFVYEAGKGVRATIYITAAHFIKPDGTLDRSRMPWI